MSEPGSLVRLLSGRTGARNYHSFVINEIGVGIAAGRLAVGSILPNDAEMMVSYGVSRTVLREALKTLEAKGLVEARAKVGTRVLPRSRWNLFDRQVLAWIFEAGSDAPFLAAFLDVRDGLECQAADLAARGRSAEQLRMILYWLNQRNLSAHLPEPCAMAEFEFHRVLFEATHNPFLRAATGIVEFGVVQAMSARLANGVAEVAATKAPLYQALATAVSGADPGAATAAMSAILAVDRADILGLAMPAPKGPTP